MSVTENDLLITSGAKANSPIANVVADGSLASSSDSDSESNGTGDDRIGDDDAVGFGNNGVDSDYTADDHNTDDVNDRGADGFRGHRDQKKTQRRRSPALVKLTKGEILPRVSSLRVAVIEYMVTHDIQTVRQYFSFVVFLIVLRISLSNTVHCATLAPSGT